MFAPVPGVPVLGFSTTTPVPAKWFNYVSENFPQVFDAVGGGSWQPIGNITLATSAAGFKLNYPDQTKPIELRGFVRAAFADEPGMPSGVGAFVVEMPLVLAGDDARFRERDPVVLSASGGFLALTSDTYRIPSLSGDVSYVLPRTTSPAPEGGESVRIVCRGNNSGKTITITSEGSQGDLCAIDGGVYVVAEFRFDATVSLAGDSLGAWFLASPVQTGIDLTGKSPYPIV